MSEDPNGRKAPGSGGVLAALGLGALAIGCCAGVPLVAALAGSVAATTLLGVGGGIVVAVALVAAVGLRVRSRRRACQPGAARGRSALPDHH